MISGVDGAHGHHALELAMAVKETGSGPVLEALPAWEGT